MAAAQLGFIDDVVVEQSRGVDHLHDCGERMVVHATIIEGARRQQQQRGPQFLAAAADDVLGNLTDQRDVRIERSAQDPVDGLEIIAKKWLQQRDGHGPEGTCDRRQRREK